MRRWLPGAVVLALAAALAITWFVGRDSGGQEKAGSATELQVDDNGCVLGVYATSDFRLDPDGGGDLVVCHFVKEPLRSEPSYTLDWSRRFDADESAAVRAAVEAAPRGELGFTGCDVAPEDGPGEFFLVLAGETVPYWVYNGACGQNGISMVGRRGGYQQRLDTADVLVSLGSTLGPLGPDEVDDR